MFLNKLYEDGLGYSAINCAKSALSTTLGNFNGKKLGENELVQRFMKGVFKLRPALPRYSSTWDVSHVLNLFNSWPENENLSLQQLTYKTIGLLALTTAQRVQSLVSIRVDNIFWEENVKIVFDVVLKTTKPNHSNPVLVLPTYVANKKHCVASALKKYVNVTEVFRQHHNTKQLLLGITKPHKPVCSQTVSNWLVTLLKLSGIDTTKYKGHSFRHSSSSAAASRGVSTDVIMSSVGWSSVQTFAKFYKRSTDMGSGSEYANSILQ